MNFNTLSAFSYKRLFEKLKVYLFSIEKCIRKNSKIYYTQIKQKQRQFPYQSTFLQSRIESSVCQETLPNFPKCLDTSSNLISFSHSTQFFFLILFHPHSNLYFLNINILYFFLFTNVIKSFIYDNFLVFFLCKMINILRIINCPKLTEKFNIGVYFHVFLKVVKG